MHPWIKLLLVFSAVLEIVFADPLIVMTPSGPVQGTTTSSFTGKIVDVFYGIPYAEPPIGKFRFGSPVDITPWTEVLNATLPTKPCYQRMPAFLRSIPDIKTIFTLRPWTEDCLKLHVWVPKPRPEKSTVMVYIHGGGFAVGDPLSIILVGATLAAEEDVIVVSMNYRLDVQGFLNLGIPEAPGNQALLDQQMALKWIQRNIASFGGNPEDVTIYGLSAGGASVGYQILAPSSRNLFKRAILMSGTPNAPWAIQNKKVGVERSLKLLEYCGCSNVNTTEALDCMKAVDPETILEWNEFPFTWKSMVPIAPTVDGNLIPHSTRKSLSENLVAPLDVMIGTMAAEGSATLPFAIPEVTKHPDGRVTHQQFHSVLKTYYKDDTVLIKALIRFLYTNWTHPKDPHLLRDGMVDHLSDYAFTCATQEFADLLLLSGSRVYRYVVDYMPSLVPAPIWAKPFHGMDISLHSGMAAAGGRFFSPEDVVLSKKVMRWWANFARNGNPNIDGATLWPPSTLENREYLRIAVNPSVHAQFRANECGLLINMMKIIKQQQNKCF